MASVKRRGELIRVTVGRDEASILAGFADEVATMLGGADPVPPDDLLEAMVTLSDSEVAAPDDPALARLLPDAYSDDDERAAEFRRLTDADLRRAKAGALQRLASTLRESGGTVELTVAAAETWLQALNDIRLVLGVRLDVSEDRELGADLPPGDPRLPLVAAYDWLTWMQEALLRSLSK
jgi:Domain of unknown function (DUF2017)